MVTVTVSSPGKPAVKLDFDNKHPKGVTVRDVKAAIQAKFPKMEFNRQRIVLPSIDPKSKGTPMTDESKTLADYGVGEGAKLRLKDLGKQVSYRQLYMWEYIGPIFLNPLLLYLSHFVWGEYEVSALQVTVRNLIVLHFIKRELESIFVHDFSRPSVPLSYVFRNCLYYWGVTGCLIGLTLYRPAYSAPGLEGSILNSTPWLWGWSLFILVNEILNLSSHLHLKSIRTPRGQPRKFPTALGFGTIVCANYFYEVNGVIALLLMTGFDLGTIVYFCIGTYFMVIWAGQKYRRYKKEFDPKVFPGKRWVMYPFVY